jgi:hypothetical protein
VPFPGLTTSIPCAKNNTASRLPVKHCGIWSLPCSRHIIKLLPSPYYGRKLSGFSRLAKGLLEIPVPAAGARSGAASGAQAGFGKGLGT